jgi:hypothetical protein
VPADEELLEEEVATDDELLEDATEELVPTDEELLEEATEEEVPADDEVPAEEADEDVPAEDEVPADEAPDEPPPLQALSNGQGCSVITDHKCLRSLSNQSVYSHTKANWNDKLIIGKSRKNNIAYLIWHTLIVEGHVHNARDGNGARHRVYFIKSCIALWVTGPLVQNTSWNIEPPLGVALAVLS